MNEVEENPDHIVITAPVPDREAFRAIVARARSMLVYSKVNDVQQMREAAAAWAESAIARPVRPDIMIEQAQINGVQGFWYRSPEGNSGSALLYFHGGGFVIGSVRGAEGVISGLVDTFKAPVLAIQYRQAPEHPHPAALEDADAAYEWLATQTQHDIIVAGESAGGALAIAAAIRAGKRGLHPARGVIASSPWLDLSMSAPSWTANRDADLVTLEMGQLFRDCFLGGLPVSTAVVPWLAADLRWLPPLLIQVGSNELALDDARHFAAAVRHAGGNVRLEIYRDAPHGFLKFANPIGDIALQRMVSWLRDFAPNLNDGTTPNGAGH